MNLFTSRRKFIIVMIASFLISISSIIPIRIAIARWQTSQPQAILTLGGGHLREVFTAKFALTHSQLPVWISSGSKEMRVREIFQEVGVRNHQIYIDRRATDTVTNFTTLVSDFKKQNINHIYLITDDFHLPRAKAIAWVVLGSKGITYTPISIATEQLPESKFKVVRDVIRSCIWILTKRTGSTLNQRNKIN